MSDLPLSLVKWQVDRVVELYHRLSEPRPVLPYIPTIGTVGKQQVSSVPQILQSETAAER